MRCLWVVPKAMYPIQDGARVANHALLGPIKNHFSELHIAVFIDNKNQADAQPYEKDFGPCTMHFFLKKNTQEKGKRFIHFLFSLLKDPSKPITATSFLNDEIDIQLRALLTNKHFDSIVFDGLHPYICFQHLNSDSKTQLIYRAHNVEQDLWTSSADRESLALKKVLMEWQGLLMSHLENELCQKASAIWAISPSDLERFADLGFKAKTQLINAGMTFYSANYELKPEDELIHLLFLGKLDWAPNTDGLRWLLDEIWPEVDQARFHLHIVGGGQFDWPSTIRENSNVTIYGFVQDLNPLFEKCDLALIPIRFGSGTRIKVIECASHGLPLLSTTMGVQGSGLEKGDYISAEEKQEWINTLNQLTKDSLEALSKRAYERLLPHYDKVEIAKKAYLSLLT